MRERSPANEHNTSANHDDDDARTEETARAGFTTLSALRRPCVQLHCVGIDQPHFARGGSGRGAPLRRRRGGQLGLGTVAVIVVVVVTLR